MKLNLFLYIQKILQTTSVGLRIQAVACLSNLSTVPTSTVSSLSYLKETSNLLD
jgi:hypothetical protein